jgi:hypothetical protein
MEGGVHADIYFNDITIKEDAIIRNAVTYDLVQKH